MLRDFDRWSSRFPGTAATLYIGGGTPSRLSPASLKTLIQAVGAPDVTVEANPEDVTDEWLDGCMEAGVTRVSLGVQSTTARFSRMLGRAHLSTEQAIKRLQNAGLKSWSVDLIFGMPDQTLEDLRTDLSTLLAWNPPHVSLYGLTIEPGTSFHALRERGSLVESDDDLWRALYDHLVDTLEEHGLRRYEVSNFAQAGHRSTHNQLYWSNLPYMGIGPSAHGYAPDKTRWSNPSFPIWRHEHAPLVEPTDPHRQAVDILVSGMRGVDGIHPQSLGSYEVPSALLGRFQEAGLLTHTPTRIALTHAGFPLTDGVIASLVDALALRSGYAH